MSLGQGSHLGHVDAVGGPCGGLPATLAALADQVAEVRTRLSGVVEQVRWTGPAAEAFRDHAAGRLGALAELMQELSDSAAAAHSLQCLVGGGVP